jgi:hypothetical protein
MRISYFLLDLCSTHICQCEKITCVCMYLVDYIRRGAPMLNWTSPTTRFLLQLHNYRRCSCSTMHFLLLLLFFGPIQFPPNCRVFLGNLAAERTTPAEIAAIFCKYGKLGEEPLLRRSFGFVQYENPEAAQAAIRGAQGVEVGGLKIDVTLADNRPLRPRTAEGGDRGDDDRRGRAGGGDRAAGNKRDRDRDGFRDKERDRSWSRERERGGGGGGPPRDDRGGSWRKGSDGGRIPDRERGGGGRPRMEPPSGVNDVFLVKVDSPSRAYCLLVEERITSMNLLYESREVEIENLPDLLKAAAEHSSVKHILVVGSRHEGNETITITTRRRDGSVEGRWIPKFSLSSMIYTSGCDEMIAGACCLVFWHAYVDDGGDVYASLDAIACHSWLL